ncbi:MAG: sugar phosphate nucleotidyltransferase [Nanoarchaeota archaeon]|nr:sugar phosphate nucleotidyltransferase [Nanoarchaeota archaeon]
MQIALVYMVAGISSRFMGKIKQFAKVGSNGETLIEYSLNQALLSGFTKIIFIVGNKTEKPFMEKFGNSYKGIPIYYALQYYDENTRDKPWGTTDALCSAKSFLDCPFVVCNGDDIYGKNSFRILAEHLKNNSDSASIGFNLKSVVPEIGKVNRGIFQQENGYITDLKEIIGIEKSDIGTRFGEDTLCSMNLFALQPEMLNELQIILREFKEKNKANRKIEALLPEDICSLIKQKKISMKLYSTPDTWLGVTNPDDEEIVRRKLAEN